MRIQPRQELLAIWRAIGKWSASGQAEVWDWAGRAGRNAISDAELLHCLLYPVSKMPGIRFDRPDATASDVAEALGPLGTPAEIPRRIVRLIKEYLDRYTDQETGRPVFSGGGSFVMADPADSRAPTARQRALEVVDAYAISIVLCIAIIDFLRGYRRTASRPAHLAEIDTAEEDASRRLTGAMVGLQRSFAVNVFGADSTEGRALCRTASMHDEFAPAVVAGLRHALGDVIAGLRELGIDPERVADLSDNPDLLFECGWSWGVLRDAAPVRTEALGELGQPGFAEAAPYLYFTVVAVDGIRDLFTARTRVRGLLSEEQQQLARTLNLQWELARRYWASIASFGGGRWPLEDLPWRTTDEDETDYYSLLVTQLVLNDLLDRRAPDADLARIAGILENLADRGRIRRRPLKDDPALALHDPGARITLQGSEGTEADAPRLGWLLSDLATLVLGRTLAVAQQVNDSPLRARLLDLADVTWLHLERRRLRGGRGAGLWDQPANVFPSLELRVEEPSWYVTNRVVQHLAAAAGVIEGLPPVASPMIEIAANMLVEAEDRYDEELLRGSGHAGPALQDSMRKQATSLRRARRLRATRPATVVALVSEVLRELDKLAAAREPEAGG
ncbi:MAG: hypothetical protein HKP61_13685 [Dactylosporangium sp.]|nr:hypothetical protein [Dactylosporangium sp.]NNJ61965.1 hypothetical protein [Dactylosporangium sp.]